MKSATIATFALVALVAAFFGGAVAATNYFINPYMEQQISHQKLMFMDQVVALKRLKNGEFDTAVDVLRTLNVYSVLLFSADTSDGEDISGSPAFEEAVVYTCDDALANSTDARMRTEGQSTEIVEACRQFKSRKHITKNNGKTNAPPER